MVLVAGFVGQLVAEPGQLPNRPFYGFTDGLGTFPGFLAQGCILPGTEYFPYLVLSDLSAIHLAPVVAVGRVRLGFEFLHALQYFGVTLPRRVGLVQHLDLSLQDRVFEKVPVSIPASYQRIFFPIGEELVVLCASFHQSFLGLFGTGGGEVPPGFAHRPLNGRDPFFEASDKGLCLVLRWMRSHGSSLVRDEMLLWFSVAKLGCGDCQGI